MAVKETNWTVFLALLFVACANLHATEAIASCLAQDVLQSNHSHTDTPSVSMTSKVVSAATTSTWKTISLGTLLSNSAVHDAFRSADCGIGDTAEQMLSQIDFNPSNTKANVDLVALSLAELGFENEEASLAAVYSRALKLGFQPPCLARSARNFDFNTLINRWANFSTLGCRRSSLKTASPASSS